MVAGWLVGAAAALVCAASLVALPGSTATLKATADRGLGSLPAAAQAPISAALGRDQPIYRVQGLQAVNPAQRLRVGFTRRGVTVASGKARLALQLSAYGYANSLRQLGPLAPRASANRVSYHDGSLTEWFANGPLGLEQGFDLAARPNAGSGPLTFSLALSGGLSASLRGGSILFSGRGAALRYTGLIATDARGRVLRSWLELAGSHVLIRVDDRGAAYPLRIDPFVQQAELTASNGAKEDELGTSVAVSGDTIVAGAPNREVGGHMEQGEAYVFTRPSSGWANASQAAELTAEKAQNGERFGQAVAVSGNTVVVGAPDHETVAGHNEQGAADVFSEPSGGWGSKQADEKVPQAAELIASDGATQDKLGSSVAVSGSTVVAGAPGHKVAAMEKRGAAYVFSEPSGGWGSKKADEEVDQLAELIASDGLAKDELGLSVAVSGSTVVAGAPHARPAHELEGQAYVFTEPAGGWGSKAVGEDLPQTTLLFASDGAQDDELGSSVAVSGTTVVAGAPGHKVGSKVSQGVAYVFSEPSAGWGSKELGEEAHQAGELTASGGAEHDDLGRSVAVSGNVVVAGAPGHKVGSNVDQGAAYVFVMPGGGWSNVTQTGELTGSNGEGEDAFGTSAALSGDSVLAGAPFHKVGANAEQGAAYVFEEPPSVSISSPVNGATYTQGQVIPTSYSCPSAPGTTVTCSGPVANGAPIDTSTLGPHTFTVSATDSDALSVGPESVTYTVVAAPVSKVPAAPILSSLSETAKRWREGKALALISRKKPPVGTTFAFTLNESASVTFTFTKTASGRRVGKSCVAPTKRNRRRKRCTRTVIAASFTFSAHAGPNKVRFDGRVSKHSKLAPGSYTLLVLATASGKSSATRTLHFTIAA